MSYVLGLNAKLYRNTGTWGTPAWDEVTNCRDVTLNVAKAEADVSTRGGNGWRQKVGTLKEGSVEFKMVWDPSGADFTAFKDAFFNDTLIDVWVADGASTTSGTSGLRAEMSVLDFTREEPLEDALQVNVKVSPGYSTNSPEWKTV